MAEGGVVKNDQEWMEVLNKIAEDIGVKWKELARKLGVKEANVANIDSEYPQLYEKAYQVLQRWYQKQGYSGGKEKLIEALRVIERNDLAVNIEIHPSTPSIVSPPIGGGDNYETALQEMSRALSDTYKDCVGSIKKDTQHDHLVYVLKVLHNIQDMNKTLMLTVNPRQANYVYSYEECRTREVNIDQLINLIIDSLSGKERSLNMRSRSDVLLRCTSLIIIDRSFTIPPDRRFLPRYEKAMEKLSRTLTSIFEDSKRNITANTGNDLLIFLFKVTKHLRDMNTILMLTANPHRGQENELYKERCKREQSIEEIMNLIIESLSFTPRKEEAPSSSTM